ncbi:GNAT family N-acetyltransferase [Aequorivita sp. SDUM287046]|uniref:GNAT family N-acetyltransferase n=1 Tax=Aequorivita aurantiaca TaxID=3053356 RepID=A0ABT8DEL8_9FLAO|nr:GNAT family N-acetyltransferase [Aequorivita aurantiaca]MDN3722954.1 GNAT family N-acetyltransferase [Aequorivita aurantiaca]
MELDIAKNIRPARPEDYNQVAPLIIQAMEDLACTFANTKNSQEAIPLFEHFFQKKSNQYSFEHTLVFEETGKILGSITFYDGALLSTYRKPFLEYIVEKYRVAELKIDDETEPNEIYIDTVSVSPHHQGKGIGKQLLAAAINCAKKDRQKRIGLLVDFNNPDAKKLYTALGFQSKGRKNLGNCIYEHLQLEL